MYERRRQALLPWPRFFLRLAGHFGIAMLLIAAALAIGMVGYHSLEAMPWIDALLNASMLLGGMGPVDRLNTVDGKLFASGYALFSGLVFISVAGILLVPIAHRVLHRLHLEMPDK